MSNTMLTEWRAVYSDDSFLDQYENGTENKYTDIDRSKLKLFALFRNGNPAIVIHLDSNKRLIYRKRVALHFTPERYEEVIYLVGWQENIKGMNVQSLSVLFPDGRVEVTDGFKENHKWFYPVNFIKEEQL